jgi:hypothetical protein
MPSTARSSTVLASVLCVGIAACGRSETVIRRDGAIGSWDEFGTRLKYDGPRDLTADLGADASGPDALADVSVLADVAGADSVDRDAPLADRSADAGSSDVPAATDNRVREDTAKDASILADLSRDTAGPGSGDGAIREAALEVASGDLGDARSGADSFTADLVPDAGKPERSADAAPMPIDGALASFCSGDSPKMVLNGEAQTPTVTGRVLGLDCCDGAEIVITGSSIGHTLFVEWRVQVGPTRNFPATIDLANPPSGWAVRMTVGCDTSTIVCYPAPDSYASGLEGALQVTVATPFSAFDTSLCLHVAEPADSPHALVHTLDLYAPHVVTR